MRRLSSRVMVAKSTPPLEEHRRMPPALLGTIEEGEGFLGEVGRGMVSIGCGVMVPFEQHAPDRRPPQLTSRPRRSARLPCPRACEDPAR